MSMTLEPTSAQAHISLLHRIALAMVLLVVLNLTHMLLFPFGMNHNKPPFEATSLSNVFIVEDDNVRTRLPGSYLPCWGNLGQFTCYGLLAGKRLKFAVNVKSEYSCSGSYGGKVIDCQTRLNSDNLAKPVVVVSSDALGLTEQQLSALPFITTIAPLPFMRWVWIALVPLYVWARWRDRQNSVGTPALS